MTQTSEVHDLPAIKASFMAKLGEHAGCYPVHIEAQFPHILARIAELWGSGEADRYLDGLMVSDRVDRAGFPPDVAMEVFRLATAHAAYGFSPKASGTGWAGVDDAALARKALAKAP